MYSPSGAAHFSTWTPVTLKVPLYVPQTWPGPTAPKDRYCPAAEDGRVALTQPVQSHADIPIAAVVGVSPPSKYIHAVMPALDAIKPVAGPLVFPSSVTPANVVQVAVKAPLAALMHGFCAMTAGAKIAMVEIRYVEKVMAVEICDAETSST